MPNFWKIEELDASAKKGLFLTPQKEFVNVNLISKNFRWSEKRRKM